MKILRGPSRDFVAKVIPFLKALLFRLWGWLPLPFEIRWRIMWLFLPKFLTGASAVIPDEGGRILLFHHTYRKKYPWGLPGGFLNHNEDAERAIVREMQEEAGFTIQVEKLLWVGTSRQYPRVDIFYLCRHIDGDFRPSEEVSDAQFFDRDTLKQVLEPELYAMLTRVLAELDDCTA